jgi:hypothetical protein
MLQKIKKEIIFYHNLIKTIIAEKSPRKKVLMAKGVIVGKWRKFFAWYKDRVNYAISPEYRKEVAKRDKLQSIYRDFYKAIKFLGFLDSRLEEIGFPRHTRRQFWRDFIKNGQVRQDIMEQLLKQYERLGQ